MNFSLCKTLLVEVCKSNIYWDERVEQMGFQFNYGKEIQKLLFITIWSVIDLVFLLQLIILDLVFSDNSCSSEELESLRKESEFLNFLVKLGTSKRSAFLFCLMNG